MGNNGVKDEWCRQLEMDLVVIQGRNINLTDNEKYLGFQMCSRGMKDSIKTTLTDRINKARIKVKDIRNLINNDLVQMNG